MLARMKTAGHGGDHARGNAFAAGVADDNQQAVVVDLDEVIEVAADLLGSACKCLYREKPPDREGFRQQGALKVPGEFQFLGSAAAVR